MNYIYFILAIIYLSFIGCDNKGNVSGDDQIVNMIKRFYTEYNAAWDRNSDYNLTHVLDSLMKEYCTNSFIAEHKILDLDHDPIIKDTYATSDYLKSIIVERDSSLPKSYTVTYIAPIQDPLGKFKEEVITISVTVRMENGTYKIDSIK